MKKIWILTVNWRIEAYTGRFKGHIQWIISGRYGSDDEVEGCTLANISDNGDKTDKISTDNSDTTWITGDRYA